MKRKKHKPKALWKNYGNEISAENVYDLFHEIMIFNFVVVREGASEVMFM